MRYPVLFGEYDLTIDDKNRLLVPSDIRKQLDPIEHGDAFFLVMGLNRRPWLYPEKYYEFVVSQTQPDVTPTEELLAFDQLNFAMAARLEWDKQGRVLIPEKTLKRTALPRELTLIGARDHAELWSRPEWDAHRESLIARSGEIASRARQVRQNAAG